MAGQHRGRHRSAWMWMLAALAVVLLAVMFAPPFFADEDEMVDQLAVEEEPTGGVGNAVRPGVEPTRDPEGDVEFRQPDVREDPPTSEPAVRPGSDVPRPQTDG